MITKVFSIYDGKAEIFNQPFYFTATGMALRAFGDLVNDNQSMISKHPEDYVLYEIGTYNDENGMFTSYTPHVNLGIGLSFKNDVQRTEGGFTMKRKTAEELNLIKEEVN